MATLRHGIPDGLSGDRRVALRFSHEEYAWSKKFGLNIVASDNSFSTLSETLNAEIRAWIKENCARTVHHVRYQLGQNKQNFVWEFFFKSAADAMLFKLRFG